jgi:hypothetical protein
LRTPICYLRTITLDLIGVSVSYHLFSLTMSDHFDFTLSFLDRDTMINGVKSFYQQKGYVIVIQKSKKGKVWFKCDVGGQHRNPEGLTDETRKRKTSTRLSGCPFKISSYLGAKDQLWHVTPHELSHNHEASSDLSGHSIARRLNIEEKKAVISLSESGVGPSQILSILKKDFNNKLSGRKEIHNFLAETRLKMLGDKTPISYWKYFRKMTFITLIRPLSAGQTLIYSLAITSPSNYVRTLEMFLLWIVRTCNK